MLTIKEAEEILKKEYDIDNFTYLMDDILLPDFAADYHDVAFSNKIFSSVKMLGESRSCDVTIFEVYLNAGTQNRRVAITQEMFRVLRGLRINNAVVAFVNADKRNYRISLLTSKFEFDGDKIVKILSNPRRLSYSLGYGTKTKTAYKFLIEKGKVNSFDELVGRFSVEVVNKQFYAEIATAFTELVGGERNGRKYEKTLDITGVADHNKYAEFGVRLIGRIMFCWFLREKRSDKGIPLVPDDMLSIDTIKKGHYYNKVLEPLFFELLNTNQKRRRAEFKTGEYVWVPYLNGGLFSPQVDDHYKYDDLTQSGLYGQVKIPDEWFVRLYSVLGEYNFTVDENTAYDIELSIDPEMLGRIFENLLAEINPETGENAKKSTGSFYTPRDIVDYMVDSSLCEYLKTKTGIEESKLHALLSYFKEDDEEIAFSNQEKRQIIDSLSTVTILDPACGSGAFPIGMLQKIVYILQVVDPEARLWLDKIIKSQGFLVKKEIEKKFGAGLLNYIRKLSVIQNSIFGIDIQPIAVEISRLRCFLSLIIEEKVDDKEENRGIEALPNLDFKFIIANSLMKLPDESRVNKMADVGVQVTMFENTDHVAQLKAVREEYFNAEPDRRSELKHEFDRIQKRMFQETVSRYDKKASQRYAALSNWSPFDNEPTDWFDPEWMFGISDGFDILIGNPPYGIVFDLEIKGIYEKELQCFKRNNDIYVAFIQFAVNRLKEKGILCFITPNTYLNGDYFKILRAFLKNNTKLKEITDYKETPVFCDPTVFVAISVFQKEVFHLPYELIIRTISQKELTNSKIKINAVDDRPIIVENPILSKIKNNCSDTIETFFYVKDVGFNYWSEGNGKKRDGNSIGDRVLYSGIKQNSLDLGYIKGRDFVKYSTPITCNYLRYDYQKYLNSNDTFRFSPDLLSVKPKIIYRQTSNCIIATIDNNSLYVDKTVHIIIPKNNIYSLYALLALLNSKLFQYLYSTISQETKGRAFSQVKTIYIKQLPLKHLNSTQRSCCEKMAIEAMNLQKNNSDISDVEKRIDSFVYELYDLDKEEISLIESSIQ